MKKETISTNQILEEVVVTPKAAEKGKRVALVLGLAGIRGCCAN